MPTRSSTPGKYKKSWTHKLDLCLLRVVSTQTWHLHSSTIISIDEDEKMVNYSAVACPWDTTTMSAEVTRDIHPLSWRFTKSDALAPYEFEYTTAVSPGNEIEQPQFQNFLAELGAFLSKHDLTNLLGLQMLSTPALDEEPGLEFTADRVNITLPMKVSGPDAEDAIEALWVFDKTLIELRDKNSTITRYQKTRQRTCVKKKTGHRKVHKGRKAEL
ncbi:MAG: hypothetical protein LQ340_002326 [Diploschistes diacapsis]|nr:MAG: hypothetical protein LQ340_002326 [Diploschistes diacapsis]